MKVVALCSELTKALELWHHLHALKGIRFYLLVSEYSPKQFFHLKTQLPLALNLIIKGRLRVTSKSLNHPRVLGWIRMKNFDVGLHAMGVIYRKPILESFLLGILNAHIGFLPKYRGRNVMEWTLFYGETTGVTVFFMDEGIDTGFEIVHRQAVDISGFENSTEAKGYLFSLDSEMYARALQRLQQPNYNLQDRNLGGKRYYVMSNLFLEVVNKILKNISEDNSVPMLIGEA